MCFVALHWFWFGDCFKRQDLSRAYLAHHELKSEFVIIVLIIIGSGMSW
jgi:hypothetical protein